MADYSRKNFHRLKKLFENDYVLLEDEKGYYWTFDDDAEALAEELEMPVHYNGANQPGLTVSEAALYAHGYDLLEIGDEDGAYFLCKQEEEILPDSAWFKAELCPEYKGHTFITAVEDYHEANWNEGIYYWKTEDFLKRLIEADMVGDEVFSFNRREYDFNMILRTDAYVAYLKRQRYFLDLDLPARTINVYKSKSYTKDNNLKQVTAYVFFCERARPVPISVYYSEAKDDYFINLASLNSYRKQYGFPFISAVPALGEHLFDNTHMADESIFHIYGYNVSQEEGLSAPERQTILARLIDFGIVTKAEAQNFLEAMISLGEKNYMMVRAVEKWYEDLSFLVHYKKGPNPDIWGTGFNYKFPT